MAYVRAVRAGRARLHAHFATVTGPALGENGELAEASAIKGKVSGLSLFLLCTRKEKIVSALFKIFFRKLMKNLHYPDICQEYKRLLLVHIV